MTLVESSVGWLGAIPADWLVKPAKALFSSPSESSKSEDVHLTPSQKYGVLPQTEYMEVSRSRVVLNLSGAESMKHVQAGDFISHLRSFQGGLEYSGLDGKISNAYTVLRPRAELKHGYYRWLFKSSLYIQGLQTTTDQLRDGQSIRFGQFALLPLPVPPLEEQQAIATFLDRETAQIDNLITKQQQLIAMLGERRGGIIRAAITEGIRGPRIMVDSGIPWIGPVVGEWIIAPLKHFAQTGAGAGFPIEEQGQLYEEITFLKVNSLGRARPDGFIEVVDDTVSRLTATRLGARVYPPNTVVLAKIGAALLLGRIRQLTADACIDNNMLAITANSSTLSRYLFYVVTLINFERIVNPGAVPSTSETAVANFKLPFPIISEQEEIVQYLDEKLQILDSVAKKTLHAVALLQERRQSLISAAVTGKLDVMQGA